MSRWSADREVRPCEHPGCSEKHKAGGLCRNHYMQKQRGEAPRVFKSHGCPNDVEQFEDYAEIILVCRRGTEVGRVKVDIEDIGLVSRYRWSKTGDGYATGHPVGTSEKEVIMHRLILNPPADMQVDHWNGDRLDNRRRNIKPVTSSENQQNVKARPNASGYLGVSKYGKKWRASIRINGKLLAQSFDDVTDAGAWAMEQRRRLHPNHQIRP